MGLKADLETFLACGRTAEVGQLFGSSSFFSPTVPPHPTRRAPKISSNGLSAFRLTLRLHILEPIRGCGGDLSVTEHCWAGGGEGGNPRDAAGLRFVSHRSRNGVLSNVQLELYRSWDKFQETPIGIGFDPGILVAKTDLYHKTEAEKQAATGSSAPAAVFQPRSPDQTGCAVASPISQLAFILFGTSRHRRIPFSPFFCAFPVCSFSGYRGRFAV